LAEEFVIKSQKIEDKVNQLLPSQGGFQAGVDFSASTMVVPIVDLTETAEGGTTRQDLQSAFSLTSITEFSVTNTTTTIINTTGYFRVFGAINIGVDSTSGARQATLQMTDGTTTKNIFIGQGFGVDQALQPTLFDVLVFVKAGDSVNIISNSADVNGNLVNPS
jgi:hypothetical protein